jgi:fructose-1,6-bisphosphatase
VRIYADPFEYSRCGERNYLFHLSRSLLLFPEFIKKFIEVLYRKSVFEDGPFSLRYTGNMVANLHTSIMKRRYFFILALPKFGVAN